MSPDSPKEKDQIAKRVRTGCLTCRRRRRKCDETKPKCRNCDEKSLECRYGLNLSFRGNNALLVGPEHTQQSSHYTRVRFVGDRHDYHADSDNANHPPGNHTDGSIPHTPKFPQAAEAQICREASTVHDVSTIAAPDPVPWQTNTDDQGGFSHTDLTEENVPRSVHYELHRGSTEVPIGGLVEHFIDKQTVMEVLAYYRYKVAPWLDIWHGFQPFGLGTSLLASEHLMIRESIYSLTAAYMRARHIQLAETMLHYNAMQGQEQPPQSSLKSSDSRNTLALIVICFSLVHKLMTSTTFSNWCATIEAVHLDFDQLHSHLAQSDVDSAVLCLFLRLDLGVALIQNRPARFASMEDFRYREQARTFRTGPLKADDSIFAFAREILLLCANSTVLHGQCVNHHPLGNHKSSNQASDNDWRLVWDSLLQWYSARPLVLHPIFEGSIKFQGSNAEDHGFTQIVFTTAVGACSNQLFHTAAYLLLQCKPKSIKLAAQKPPVTSKLWHCLRICSIAQTIDQTSDWDIPQLGSLLIAGQQMTHTSQQRIVGETLERASEAFPGWPLADSISALQQHWKYADVG